MSNKILLESIKVGDLALKNRIIMAPLTRCRADYKTGIPTELHADYYSQRASAGLIISEAAWIHRRGHGYPGAGGICEKPQVEGWKKVTKAVHDKGGKIFCQLFHCGRQGHPDLFGGLKALAPSAVQVEDGSKVFTGSEWKTYDEPPQEMTKQDIKEVIEATDLAGKYALEAGFDGVEVHSANAYLFDEFLKDHTNRRTDEYGGSFENRSRLLFEVIDKLSKTWGPGRIGVKFSPVGRYLDMYESNPKGLYKYLGQELTKKNIAYICFVEDDGTKKPKRGGLGSEQIPNNAKEFRPAVGVKLMTNGKLDFKEAERRIREGEADLACFGVMYISNPDLVERYKNDWPLARANSKTFYTPGPNGYNDYPRYKEGGSA